MIDGLPGLLFLLAFLAILAGCAVIVRHDDKRRELDVYAAVRDAMDDDRMTGAPW